MASLQPDTPPVRRERVRARFAACATVGRIDHDGAPVLTPYSSLTRTLLALQDASIAREQKAYVAAQAAMDGMVVIHTEITLRNKREAAHRMPRRAGLPETRHHERTLANTVKEDLSRNISKWYDWVRSSRRANAVLRARLELMSAVLRDLCNIERNNPVHEDDEVTRSELVRDAETCLDAYASDVAAGKYTEDPMPPLFANCASYEDERSYEELVERVCALGDLGGLSSPEPEPHNSDGP